MRELQRQLKAQGVKLQAALKAASIADMRVASTLEFLAAIDYPMPAWAKAYIADMESALGKAYLEPAGDVRGYVQYAKSQKK